MANMWMKTLREENIFGPLAVGDAYPLQEPAWRDDDDLLLFRLDGSPKGRPIWDAGDLVVLYMGGPEHTAALLEVTGSAYESGDEDWPWSTDTKVLASEVRRSTN